MIVDVHTHLWDRPEQWGQGAAERLAASAAGPWDLLDGSVQAFDDAMLPVDAAIVLGFRSLLMDAAVTHEQVAAYVDRSPGRLLGFAGVDPLALDALDAVRQAVEMGLVGIVVSPAAQDCHPTHSRALKVYELCESLGLPVFFHPGFDRAPAANLEFARPHLLDPIGREFPKLKVLIAQLGYPWIDETLVLINKHRTFFADLSDVAARPWQLYNVLTLAIQQHATDRLLLGSDFPFLTPEEAIVNIYSVQKLTHGTGLPMIPRAILQSIVERDSLACLGLSHHLPDSADDGATPAAAAESDDDEPVTTNKTPAPPVPPTNPVPPVPPPSRVVPGKSAAAKPLGNPPQR